MPEYRQVAGFEAVKRKMRDLAPTLQRKYMRPAVGAGAVVVRDEARILAPVSSGDKPAGRTPSGTLRKNIIAKYIPERSRGSRVTYFVTVRRGKKFQAVVRRRGGKSVVVNEDAYYWFWVEFGHLARGPGQKILGGKRRAARTRERLRASGARFIQAKPYMRPAFEHKKGDALDVIVERLRAGVEEIGRR